MDIDNEIDDVDFAVEDIIFDNLTHNGIDVPPYLVGQISDKILEFLEKHNLLKTENRSNYEMEEDFDSLIEEEQTPNNIVSIKDYHYNKVVKELKNMEQ